MRHISGHGIVADADRGQTARKGLDPMPIRPLALGKQQMQLGILSALRL